MTGDKNEDSIQKKIGVLAKTQELHAKIEEFTPKKRVSPEGIRGFQARNEHIKSEKKHFTSKSEHFKPKKHIKPNGEEE